LINRRKITNFHTLKNIKKGKYGKYEAICILYFERHRFILPYITQALRYLIWPFTTLPTLTKILKQTITK